MILQNSQSVRRFRDGYALRAARHGAGPRNQIARRALLGMDSRKPYETPQWWPGDGGREAMCCSFCGGRDHRYEDCPQRADPPDVPLDKDDREAR